MGTKMNEWVVYCYPSSQFDSMFVVISASYAFTGIAVVVADTPSIAAVRLCDAIQRTEDDYIEIRTMTRLLEQNIRTLVAQHAHGRRVTVLIDDLTHVSIDLVHRLWSRCSDVCTSVRLVSDVRQNRLYKRAYRRVTGRDPNALEVIDLLASVACFYAEQGTDTDDVD